MEDDVHPLHFRFRHRVGGVVVDEGMVNKTMQG